MHITIFFTIDIFPYQENKWIVSSMVTNHSILFILSFPSCYQLGSFCFLAIIKWL